MRILRVLSTINPEFGGPIEGVAQTSKIFYSQGHQTEVVCLDNQTDPWTKAFPCPVHAIGGRRSGYGYSSQFLPWLKEHAPLFDVVTVHGIWQYHSFAVWQTLRNTSTPYFVFTHGMLDPWFKRTYPLKHLKKCLYWPWAEYRVLRDATGVCFTCEEEKVLARQSFSLYKGNEIVVNYGTARPPGNVEAQKEAFLQAFPELKSKRLLLFLSRIHPKKGCDLLITAFAGIASLDPSLHLVIAGPDQIGWQAQLYEQAHRLGMAERITWTGMLSGDLKWGAFHLAEVFVLPSHQENFGIAVAEALACGLPVLISNQVNIWREIEADEAGLVGDDTTSGTTEVLQQWLNLSTAARQSMQQNARHCFETRFEIHRAAHSLLQVLREGVLSKHEN